MSYPFLLRFFDLAGVAVFASSGALAAGRKRLDLFGVCVTAVVTAIGGGTLRDLLLGRPVFWIDDPAYLPMIVAATGLTLVYTRFRVPPLRFLLFADALGLSMFSVTGAQTAQARNVPWMVVLLMGTITGVAGGMIRDVVCNEIPLVLRGGYFYATAAIGGVGLYCALHALGVPEHFAAPAGMAAVLALRLTSITLGLSLPRYDLPDPGK
jgi:uncharacterized membrane protein YeiH